MTGFGFGADRFGWTDEALELVRNRRGWTEPTIERLELSFDAASGRVGFPIRDQTLDELGTLYYLPDPDGRNGRRKLEQPSGVPRQLFPPPESLPQELVQVLLLEGEPDVVAAQSGGFAAVGVPGTAGWKDEYAARFAGRRWTVYVVFDCDGPGRAAAVRAAEALVRVGVDARVVDLDPNRDDGYDLTDYLIDAGELALAALLDAAPLYTLPTAELEDGAPWRAQPWPEFRDEAPEEHRWLVDGLVPAGALAFIAGPPKKGKTWIGLALALAIATGRPLLGEYAATPGAVLYVALEGSRTGLRARIGALARGFGVDPDDAELDRLSMLYRPRPFNLAELSTAGWLSDEAHRIDAVLIVVDVLRAAARFQENVAEDFARVRDALEPLLAEERTALLLHHFGKLTETQKERSPGERMAGTGAMYGALDVGLLITASSEGAKRMTVAVEARDFAAPDALAVAITGEGSGEHGGFTFADTATFALDDEPFEEGPSINDLLVELFETQAVPRWLLVGELAKPKNRGGIGRNQDLIREALEADAELGPSRRFQRLERGDYPGVERRKIAQPVGTVAMFDALMDRLRAQESVESDESVMPLERFSDSDSPLTGGESGESVSEGTDSGPNE